MSRKLLESSNSWRDSNTLRSKWSIVLWASLCSSNLNEINSIHCVLFWWHEWSFDALISVINLCPQPNLCEVDLIPIYIFIIKWGQLNKFHDIFSYCNYEKSEKIFLLVWNIHHYVFEETLNVISLICDIHMRYSLNDWSNEW